MYFCIIVIFVYFAIECNVFALFSVEENRKYDKMSWMSVDAQSNVVHGKFLLDVNGRTVKCGPWQIRVEIFWYFMDFQYCINFSTERWIIY